MKQDMIYQKDIDKEENSENKKARGTEKVRASEIERMERKGRRKKSKCMKEILAKFSRPVSPLYGILPAAVR